MQAMNYAGAQEPTENNKSLIHSKSKHSLFKPDGTSNRNIMRMLNKYNQGTSFRTDFSKSIQQNKSFRMNPQQVPLFSEYDYSPNQPPTQVMYASKDNK